MKPFCALLLAGTLWAACNAPSLPSLCITDFGAQPMTDCTTAIQEALDSAASIGGGRVVIPAGRFLSATLTLPSHVELHLEEGAVLQGVEHPEAYSSFIPQSDLSRYDSGNGTANSNCVNDRRWMRALIVGNGIEGASITGKGTLDGAHVFDPLGEESMRGPHTVIIGEAKDFRMEGVTITRAANYAFLGYALENALFQDLTMTEGWDGIHIRGARDVAIRDCRFQTGDDSIAGGYWNNMEITGCDINSSCNGIRMIMPSENVDIHHCHFWGPGVYPHRTSGEARRTNMLFGVILEPGAWGPASGEMSGIRLRHLQMENLSSAVSTSVREGSVARDLTLEDIQAKGLNGSLTPVVSWNDQGFESIVVRDCSFSR